MLQGGAVDVAGGGGGVGCVLLVPPPPVVGGAGLLGSGFPVGPGFAVLEWAAVVGFAEVRLARLGESDVDAAVDGSPPPLPP